MFGVNYVMDRKKLVGEVSPYAAILHHHAEGSLGAMMQNTPLPPRAGLRPRNAPVVKQEGVCGMKMMVRKILFLWMGLLFPWSAMAQDADSGILVESSAPKSSASASINVLCSSTAKLYSIAAQYEAEIDEQNKHRDKQERVTVEIEQHKKIDPKGEHPRQPTSNEPYYTAMFTREPTVCARLNTELDQFITANEGELRHAVDDLVARTPGMGDAEKQQMAKQLADCTDPNRHPSMRVGKKVLYSCIYRTKNIRNVPLPYSVEKTMRRLYTIQLPLLDAWLGNVD